MAVSFKKFAFTTMSWLLNSLWFLLSTFFIRLLCTLFPRVCDQGSGDGGSEEVVEKPDDRNESKRFGYDCVGVSGARTSKYEFLGGNSFCGYIEGPEITSFKVRELFVNSGFEDGETEDSVVTVKTGDSVDQEVGEEAGNEGFGCTEDPSSSTGDDFREVDDDVDQVEIESSVGGDEPALEEDMSVRVALCESEEIGLRECVEEEVMSVDHEDESPWENQLVFSFGNVKQETSVLANDFWHTNGKFIADCDGFYGDQGASEEALAPETPMCLDTRSADPYEEDLSGSDSVDSGDDDHHKAEEEEECDKTSEREMEDTTSNHVSDDETDIDVLMEHQSYVQQMKKEMKNLRTKGLPTILEDTESPRMDEDLKPLKIDDKVGYKDRVDEIQRFYKTYLEKMKRLDILCHQTMYAVGFLQLKNPDQVAANRKLSLPSIKSLLAHNLLPSKFRRHESDPVLKLIRDLQRDLELVYVGQLCISWEILKWQHLKAEELQMFDTMGLRQYSLVAGEFQQFQVLVTRFAEDEPFQGPRVENYVKSRCASSNFMQVPPIKEDSKNAEDRQAVVSIVRLTDIIEESMHAFWDFVRADKKEAGNVGVRDPLDAELLYDIRTSLAKKERRIKDLVRSGNCIVKKFQKHQECRLTHDLLLALVDLKLVGRVIGMSRLTTDQLMWCHKKVSKIGIVGRKVHIESSFSLFPC